MTTSRVTSGDEWKSRNELAALLIYPGLHPALTSVIPLTVPVK